MISGDELNSYVLTLGTSTIHRYGFTASTDAYSNDDSDSRVPLSVDKCSKNESGADTTSQGVTVRLHAYQARLHKALIAATRQGTVPSALQGRRSSRILSRRRS